MEKYLANLVQDTTQVAKKVLGKVVVNDSRLAKFANTFSSQIIVLYGTFGSVQK